VLPLLRRTFAQFPFGERRVLGERLRSGSATALAAAPAHAADFDEEAAQAVLPVLALIWSEKSLQ